MARKVDAFFPDRQRPRSMHDMGYVGRAHNVHIYNADITDVNEWVDDHVPQSAYIWIVAFGNVYICSPPSPDCVDGKLLGKEHRTIMANVPKSRFFSDYYQKQLKLDAKQFFNPATELHEIDYFSIRYKEPRAMQQQPPKPPDETKPTTAGQRELDRMLQPGTKEYEEHVKRSRRSVPKKYRD